MIHPYEHSQVCSYYPSLNTGIGPPRSCRCHLPLNERCCLYHPSVNMPFLQVPWHRYHPALNMGILQPRCYFHRPSFNTQRQCHRYHPSASIDFLQNRHKNHVIWIWCVEPTHRFKKWQLCPDLMQYQSLIGAFYVLSIQCLE